LEEQATGLVRRAQAGESAAREELLTCCHGTIRRWARVLTEDQDEADDVAQEVLIRVALRLDRYAGRSRFTTWLYQVTRNTALGLRRRVTRRLRETHDNLERIARVLSQFDRPRPLVRLTFHLIQADGAAASDPGIADIEATLRKLFRFRGYRMVEEGIFSANEGGNVQQQLGGAGYLIAAEIRRVSGTGDSAIVELAVHLRGRDVQFGTEVGVPVGKTAVLGNVGEDPRGTLILTVKPELVSVSP